jgi:hypothetical protein
VAVSGTEPFPQCTPEMALQFAECAEAEARYRGLHRDAETLDLCQHWNQVRLRLIRALPSARPPCLSSNPAVLSFCEIAADLKAYCHELRVVCQSLGTTGAIRLEHVRQRIDQRASCLPNHVVLISKKTPGDSDAAEHLRWMRDDYLPAAIRLCDECLAMDAPPTSPGPAE